MITAKINDRHNLSAIFKISLIELFSIGLKIILFSLHDFALHY